VQIVEQSYKFERPVMSKNRTLRHREGIAFSYSNLLDILTASNTSQPVSAPSSNPAQDRKMRINVLLEKKKNPIIIVPEHLHPGNICLGNIEQFLVKETYVETAGNAGYKQWADFEYELRGRKVKFDVTNNGRTLNDDDWNCVVGVFVEGRPGEFNMWKKSDPAELFRFTKGFLMRFPTKEATVAHDWNIKMFTLDKNVRYRDSEISRAIWKDIESFLY
jgi:hypothetical protein